MCHPGVQKTPKADVMLSHQGTLNTVDKMEKDHDSELLEWVEELKSIIDIEQVMFHWDAIYDLNVLFAAVDCLWCS